MWWKGIILLLFQYLNTNAQISKSAAGMGLKHIQSLRLAVAELSEFKAVHCALLYSKNAVNLQTSWGKKNPIRFWYWQECVSTRTSTLLLTWGETLTADMGKSRGGCFVNLLTPSHYLSGLFQKKNLSVSKDFGCVAMERGRRAVLYVSRAILFLGKAELQQGSTVACESNTKLEC